MALDYGMLQSVFQCRFAEIRSFREFLPVDV
jgi:hypothetical protein